MKIYARVASSIVLELFQTDVPIGGLFHPGVHWTDVTEVAGIRPGWHHDGASFVPPELNVQLPVLPSLSQLAREIAELKSEFAKMLGSTRPASHSN